MTAAPRDKSQNRAVGRRRQGQAQGDRGLPPVAVTETVDLPPDSREVRLRGNVSLAIPLTRRQVDAADRLHARMRQWQAADRALQAVAEQFREFDLTVSLVKVVCLNSLYGTNVYAIHRMAAHIARVMGEIERSTAGIELVERIATLPKAGADEEPRQHWSFASKFCHFFIDAERFPILDTFAAAALRRHLGPRNCSRDERRYVAFAKDIEALKRLSGLPVTLRQLDHYLWIAGAYFARQKNPELRLNADLDQMMNSKSAKRDLYILVGGAV